MEDFDSSFDDDLTIKGTRSEHESQAKPIVKNDDDGIKKKEIIRSPEIRYTCTTAASNRL